MEMPELNDELMECDTQATEEPAAAPAGPEDVEMAAAVVEEADEAAEPAPQVDDDTLDSADIPKEDVVPEEVAPEEVPTEQEKSDVDEPPEKRAKSDTSTDEAQKTEPDEEEDKKKGKDENIEDKPDTDMLSTLASAALNQDEKDEKSEVPAAVVKEESQTGKKRSEQWHNIGVFETNTTTVTDYLAASEATDEVPDATNIVVAGRRIQLEPGTAYKLRVCAINACGAGPWSEVAAFKTTLPGFPGAPSAIKISKSADGAHLTWEPPGGNSGEILEYAVYLAVRSASQGSQPVNTTQAQLAFVRVFCGPTNKCVVGPNSLQAAHIDTTTKPAIIFRIAARNAKGYGPATQVRWLQESATSPSGAPNVAKRVTKV